MFRRDWKHFKYELADMLFGAQMDEAFREGMASGTEYTSRTLNIYVSHAELTQNMTKTQLIGFEVAREALRAGKKEVMRKTGVAL